MKKTNHNLIQGVTFKVMTDYGVTDEQYQRCLKAIADILMETNDYVNNTHVGHGDIYLNTMHEIFEKDKDMIIKYYK